MSRLGIGLLVLNLLSGCVVHAATELNTTVPSTGAVRMGVDTNFGAGILVSGIHATWEAETRTTWGQGTAHSHGLQLGYEKETNFHHSVGFMATADVGWALGWVASPLSWYLGGTLGPVFNLGPERTPGDRNQVMAFLHRQFELVPYFRYRANFMNLGVDPNLPGQVHDFRLGLQIRMRVGTEIL